MKFWAVLDEICEFGFVVYGFYLFTDHKPFEGLACFAFAKANMAYRKSSK